MDRVITGNSISKFMASFSPISVIGFRKEWNVSLMAYQLNTTFGLSLSRTVQTFDLPFCSGGVYTSNMPFRNVRRYQSPNGVCTRLVCAYFKYYIRNKRKLELVWVGQLAISDRHHRQESLHAAIDERSCQRCRHRFFFTLRRFPQISFELSFFVFSPRRFELRA